MALNNDFDHTFNSKPNNDDEFAQLDKFDDPKTRKYIQAQYKHADHFLKDTRHREKIQETVLEVWNHPKYSLLERHGNYYFYTVNTGLQEQSVIYRQTNIFDGSEVLLDPNELSKDGSIYLVHEDSAFSYDGTYFAYCLREKGSDWIKIKIKNTETNMDSPETLVRVKFTRIAWTHDEEGFFYSCYPANPAEEWIKSHTLFYHRVGQPQSQDDLVLEFPDKPHWVLRGQVSHSGKKLIVEVNNIGFLRNHFFYADITNVEDYDMLTLQFFPVFLKSYSVNEYVGDDGNNLLFKTNMRMERYEIVSFNVKTHEFLQFEAADDKYLQSFAPARASALVHYMNWEHVSCLRILTYQGSSKVPSHEYDIDIEPGTILSVSSSLKLPYFFVYFSTYINYSMYLYDWTTTFFPCLLRKEYLKLRGDCSQDYETIWRTVWISNDNVVFVKIFEHKKYSTDTWNERQPRACLLNVMNEYCVEKGCELDPIPLLFAHLTNGFYVDAYISCTYLLDYNYDLSPMRDLEEVVAFLIDNKLTTREKLAITNSATAAMLLTRSITCNPSLCQAVVVKFSLVDHDSHEYSKYGDGSEPIETGNPQDRPAFRTFSTKFQIKQSERNDTYPAVLILVNENDGRLNSIPYKFAAALQKTANRSPFRKRLVLLKHFTGRNYSAQACTSAKIEQFTDILTFLIKTLKIQ